MLKDVNKYAVVKEVNKYVKLIGAINDYMMREYGHSFEGFKPDGVAGIAYTGYEFETESGKWLEVSEIQVNLDVVNLQWRTYADGKLVLVEQRESLEEIASEIWCSNFEDIIANGVGEIQELIDAGAWEV